MSFASVTGSLPPFPANASGSLTNDGDGHLSWIENGPSDYAADLLSGPESTGGVPYQSGENETLFAVGTSGQILKSNGAAAPAWVAQSSLSVGSATTATNATTASEVAGGAAGNILYQSAASNTSFIANGTAGQVLTSNGGAAPSWTTSTATNAVNLIGGLPNQIVYQSAIDTTNFLGTGEYGQILKSAGPEAVPFWDAEPGISTQTLTLVINPGGLTGLVYTVPAGKQVISYVITNTGTTSNSDGFTSYLAVVSGSPEITIVNTGLTQLNLSIKMVYF